MFVLEGLRISVAVFVGTSTSFLFFRYFVTRFLVSDKDITQGRDKDIAAADISNWIVSIVQACSATLTGVYVIYACSMDDAKTNIVYGCRCKAVEIYLWVLWAYFVSDTCRLYHIHQLRNSYLDSISKYSFFYQATTIHHLILALVVLPLFIFVRNPGVGDLFFGIAFIMESSTPFVAIRNIMKILKINQEGYGHLINMTLLTMTYFTVRILPLPIVLHMFASNSHSITCSESFSGSIKCISRAAMAIPKKCQLGTLVFYTLQIYWFRNICRSWLRIAKKKVLNGMLSYESNRKDPSNRDVVMINKIEMKQKHV